MASEVWTLSSLVGAYLDLVVAFFSLCASVIVFLTVKFLGIFGLRLPYLCNWLVGISPNEVGNLHRLLVDFASEKVSNVKISIEEKCHFNGHDVHLRLRLIGEREDVHSHNDHAFVETKDGAQSSSVSDVWKPNNDDKIEIMPKSDDRVVMNVEGIKKYRPRRSVDHCRSFTFSRGIELEDDQLCPASIDNKWNEMDKDRKELFYDGTDSCCSNDDRHVPRVAGFGPRESFKLDENVFPDDEETSENDSSIEELNGSDNQVEQVYEVDDKIAKRLLGKALEEESAARAALYLELEKERNAAATAAEEAMAMILRLQEGKASTEMEARQYQRIVEEKCAYEADEMDILKEILLQRETEKHLLEKEVEAYRQMIYLGNEQFPSTDDQIADTERNLLDLSCDLSEDHFSTLSQFSASAEKNVISVDKQTSETCLGIESHIQGKDECLSSLSSNKEHHVYDVHEIADGSKLCNKGNNNKEGLLPVNANVKSDQKTHSMPALDNEKLELENRVDCVDERLKTVQEGSEEFIQSMERCEMEKVQFKL